MDTMKELHKLMMSAIQFGRIFIASMLYVLSLITARIKVREGENKK